ncbi:MAG: NAD-dependent epimerase/dehydratase family protein [Tagaea sp.]|nr:NAD-dependent epimerase/dehydratase family protein [Tagaea sp.]
MLPRRAERRRAIMEKHVGQGASPHFVLEDPAVVNAADIAATESPIAFADLGRRALAARGFEVTGTWRAAPPAAGGFRALRVDLEGPLDDLGDFESVFHCAAEIPARCPDPDRLHAANASACTALFERALERRARCAVFLSSMSVYGAIGVARVTEDVEPAALDAYGRSKLDGEAALARAVERGLPSGLSLRLPGTVGRGSHDNFLSAARVTPTPRSTTCFMSAICTNSWRSGSKRPRPAT